MANDEEPIKKALMTSSLVVVTSEDSVDSNLATLMVDSGASGHNFDDDIILNLKHRLQDYVHLAMPRKILNAGRAVLDGTAEGVLQGNATDDNCNQILVRVDIVVVPGIGHNLFSVVTAAKKALQPSPTTKSETRGVQRHHATTEREWLLLLVYAELECGVMCRRGANNERSRQCPGVEQVAGSSP